MPVVVLVLAACRAASPVVLARDPAPPQPDLAAQAAGIADAFSNVNATLTRDGSQVVFASNREGSYALYVADVADPASPARKLLAWPQPIEGASLTGDGKALVFTADAGGNELPLLYRMALAGGAPVELTGGQQLARDGVILPAERPGSVYYSARDPAATAWAIYEARLDASQPPHELYREPSNGLLLDVRRDGKVGLIQHFRTWSDRMLLSVDLERRSTKRLYPPTDRETSIYAAGFAADGRVIVATDGGAEQALVLALDPATGRELAQYAAKPATARIDGMVIAPRGDVIALTLDAGNHTVIELVEQATLEPRCRAALPLGAGSLGELSHDGKQLTVTWSTPAVPNDIFVIEVATCKATPLRREVRPSLAELVPIASQIVDIPAFDGLALPTNVHLPRHPAGARLPVIVRYHGGPAGSATMGWQRLARFFLDQGYAWVEPNVRGSGGFGRAFEQADNGERRLDAFHDLETTAQWVAAQPWADRERMIVLGESYGGYAVLMTLIKHGALWRAGVDLFGVTDLSTFLGTTTGRVRANYLVELGDPARDAAFLQSISPLAQVAQIADPLFVYAGANDPRVPRSQSDAIAAALRDRRIPVEYMVAADEGHGIEAKETFVELCTRLARFLAQHAGSARPR
ncbi:MAG: prolyl oligopeptidase family serine peptidase [Kofleriaceae bacterium]